MSTNSRTVLSSFPPMKSNALHITRDSIRIFVPLRPLYGVPVYLSAGGDATSPPAARALVRAGRIILPTTGRRGQHSAEAPAANEPPMGGSVLPRSKKTTTLLGGRFGRGRKARTLDTRFWRPLLYQLSYTPIWWAFGDSNPGPDGYEPSALTN